MLIPMLLLVASPVITVQAEQPKGEIGYEKGSLGFDALMARDYAAAERQLLRASPDQRRDSAWMINYGQVLLHSGRVDEAVRLFRRAAAMNDGELILADGKVVTSQEAATAALARVKRLAGR